MLIYSLTRCPYSPHTTTKPHSQHHPPHTTTKSLSQHHPPHTTSPHRVVSVVSKEKAKPRPAALNTVELMKVASAGLGLSPHSAMVLAERLYIQGYISYPRTETTSYSENFDLRYACYRLILARLCYILTSGMSATSFLGGGEVFCGSFSVMSDLLSFDLSHSCYVFGVNVLLAGISYE